jgi:hypothetical protein
MADVVAFFAVGSAMSESACEGRGTKIECVGAGQNRKCGNSFWFLYAPLNNVAIEGAHAN